MAFIQTTNEKEWLQGWLGTRLPVHFGRCTPPVAVYIAGIPPFVLNRQNSVHTE
jgi:hypothetical protein